MLPIVFCDEHLVAIHKPAGLLVHRTVLDAHERRFALQMLRQQIGRRVYPVHRLDKGASGVLLFALSREVGRMLGAMFEQRQVGKRYLAVVRGYPDAAGEIDHRLRRHFDAVERVAEAALAAAAQEAISRYRRLATIELPYRVDRYPTSRYALVELEPPERPPPPVAPAPQAHRASDHRRCHLWQRRPQSPVPAALCLRPPAAGEYRATSGASGDRRFADVDGAAGSRFCALARSPWLDERGSAAVVTGPD
jgi:hypothetical protein